MNDVDWQGVWRCGGGGRGGGGGADGNSGWVLLEIFTMVAPNLDPNVTQTNRDSHRYKFMTSVTFMYMYVYTVHVD